MEKKKENNAKKKLVRYSYVICSLMIAFMSSAILWYANNSSYWPKEYFGYITLTLVGLIFCVVYWFFAKMYQAQKIGIYRLTELVYFQLLSFGFADVILLVEMIIYFHRIEKIQFITFIVMGIVQMVAITLVIFVHNRLFAKYDEPRKVVIVYGKKDYVSLLKKIKAKKFRYNVIGCFEDNITLEMLRDTLLECESVYLYEVNDVLRKELILYCDALERDVYITQSTEDLITMGFDISHTFDTPFIRTKRMPVKWYYPFVKRTFDIVASSLALIVLSPLFLVVSIAIKAHDGGPVFYTQDRAGKDHKVFRIYKFRSMITDAEANGMRRATGNDDRITPVGKIIRATRIDELPQLLNIIKGDMSIVGPRPERVELDEIYTKQIPEFALRLKVRAGLTGYAQVFGKYNTTPEDKLKLDLLYINQRSVLMDLKLILYTVKIMFIPESTEGFEEDESTLDDIEKKQI